MEPTAQLATAEAGYNAANAELTAANTQLADLKAEQAKRETARKDLPDKIAQARQRIASPIEDEVLTPAADDPAIVRSAKELAIASRRANQNAELAAYEAEVNSYIQRADLLLARLELADRTQRLTTDLVARLQKVVNNARTREAENQADKAEAERRKAAQAHTIVSAVAEMNADLANRRTGDEGLPARISEATTDLAEAEAKLKEVNEDFKGIEERIEKVGMTDAVGLLLRRKKGTLPHVSLYEDRIRRREALLSTIQREFLDVDDRLHALRDMDAAVGWRRYPVTHPGARTLKHLYAPNWRRRTPTSKPCAPTTIATSMFWSTSIAPNVNSSRECWSTRITSTSACCGFAAPATSGRVTSLLPVQRCCGWCRQIHGPTWCWRYRMA